MAMPTRKPLKLLAMAMANNARPYTIDAARTKIFRRPVQLSRVPGRDGQHRERGCRARYHPVGAFGIERFGTHIEHGGDREEKGEHPLTCPGRVIHGLPQTASGPIAPAS